jgi:glycosyltransferase involved in cell wall biosynthesis
MIGMHPLEVLILVELENVHHRRFATAIAERGHHVRLLPAESDIGSVDVVLAGPLPHLAEHALAIGDAPVVAVSWGSDLLRDVVSDPKLARRTAAVFARAAAVIVDSQAGAEVAVAHGADPATVYRFPWGIDLMAHPFMPVPDGPVRLVSLRSLVPEYLIETLLRAIALTPDVEVDLAGDGSASHALHALAEEMGVSDRVRFHGAVPEAGVPALLAQAHVHVSTTPTDGSSISLLQALATGRPSIVVDNPANREWIVPELTGWLVPPGDAEALAACIAAVCADPEPLPRMAAAGRQIAEAHADWTVNRRVLWEAVETAARRGRTGEP